MPADAFFIEPGSVSGDRAALGIEELRHARGVLRLGAGDQVTLLDGEGVRYRARFVGGGPREGELKVLSREVEPPPVLSLTLALAPLKGERFEWAVQKACELGVAEVVPLLTGRTEGRRGGGGAREERLKRIVTASCKQCGRARFLRLAPPIPLDELDLSRFARAVALSPTASAALGDALGARPLTSCLVVVGPEGGFTREEVAELTARGAAAATLGPRTLRAETAAVAAAALVQYLAGDLSQGAGR